MRTLESSGSTSSMKSCILKMHDRLLQRPPTTSKLDILHKSTGSSFLLYSFIERGHFPISPEISHHSDMILFYLFHGTGASATWRVVMRSISNQYSNNSLVKTSRAQLFSHHWEISADPACMAQWLARCPTLQPKYFRLWRTSYNTKIPGLTQDQEVERHSSKGGRETTSEEHGDKYRLAAVNEIERP